VRDIFRRFKEGEHLPMPNPTPQGCRIFLRKLAHSGWKKKVWTMGWYASREGGEYIGEAGWRSPFPQVKNPCNKTYFSFHL